MLCGRVGLRDMASPYFFGSSFGFCLGGFVFVALQLSGRFVASRVSALAARSFDRWEQVWHEGKFGPNASGRTTYGRTKQATAR
jgi:hypothetical protein